MDFKQTSRILASAIKQSIFVKAMISLGGGFIPFVFLLKDNIPAVAPTVASTIIALLLISISLAIELASMIKHQTWFDRKYHLISSKWEYTLNKDGNYLDGICTYERDLECLDTTIKYIKVEIRKANSAIQFIPCNEQRYEIELISCSKGDITISRPFRSEGSAFAYKMHFNPALTKGDRVHFKWKCKIPSFKIASYEELIDKQVKADMNPARDYENNSFQILYPTDIFEYEIHMDRSCKTKFSNLIVERGTSSFPDEESTAIKNLKISKYTDGSWSSIFRRNKPPMKAYYSFRWTPALAAEINKQQESSSQSPS